MDGGIQLALSDILAAFELFGTGTNGILMIVDRVEILADSYGNTPRLLPLSRKEYVPAKYKRKPGQAAGWEIAYPL